MNQLTHHWRLNPEIAFLNHGSFGAAPLTVLQHQRKLQDELERDPIAFLNVDRELGGMLERVREAIASFVGADASDIAWVRNATDGVNAVVRSFPFRNGDEVVITNHGYNACNNAARFAAERVSAEVQVAEIPFPLTAAEEVTAAIDSKLTDRTRLLVVDHVTSPTGIVFPIAEIVAAAHQKGVRVLVDGAHAPGMIPLDLNNLGADYYTANHHKWLCAPKASGFLFVRQEWQEEVRPTSISHGANRPRAGQSRFLTEFDWPGTFDPTPLLSTPAAIAFLEQLRPGGIAAHLAANRELALQARNLLACALQVSPPSPDNMIGSLATIPLPIQNTNEVAELKARLFDQHRIEAPVFTWPDNGPGWCRISAQAYNTIGQYEQLAEALREELG